MQRLRRSWERHWYAWAMVGPVVVVIAVLVLYPLLYGLFLSFTDANEANVAKNIGANHIPATFHLVGLHNYWQVLSGADGHFYPRLVWTIVWTVGCVAFTYGIGVGLAVLLNRPIRGKIFYRLALILPWAVPNFIGVYAWRLMLNGQYGVFNRIIGLVGIPGQAWLDGETAQKVAVIIVNVWLGVPFMVVALLGGLQSIPAELHEAGEMDGASPWQRFRSITLPSLRPVSSTVILLGTIWTFNMFNVIYLLLGQNTTGSTDILVTYGYNLVFNGVANYSMGSTYGIVVLLILLGFSIFYGRRQLKEEQL
ncbi:ABC transporter permease [Mangrovactinospora gilvigrisea]|uniref:ABC transporter permease n=1 Tax=Mangrovactinospora gilvigrisea TaxID=1428644 RepID=A0A1J7BDW0_9ACTN|nr:sugar ABC transporter permease [Mangrovactinospora gilvigrisea]OIV36863.1 ABC transporter permease [Mangrovactinospora gilvigrisea]